MAVWSIVRFKALPGYKIEVSFADGTTGIADLAPRLLQALVLGSKPRQLRLHIFSHLEIPRGNHCGKLYRVGIAGPKFDRLGGPLRSAPARWALLARYFRRQYREEVALRNFAANAPSSPSPTAYSI